MRVAVARPGEALEEITGTVVVIDVFRASNTILALLASGAAEVALLADIDAARELKRRQPGWPLLGERGGLTQAGCDGGNSPVAAGRVLGGAAAAILTTSAGTQGVARLAAAARIVFASFANADAVVRWVLEADDDVTLLPMGLEARAPAAEDDLAAAWLAARLRGAWPPWWLVRRQLLDCAGAARLRRLRQDDDLAWCTRLDSHELVPVVVPGDPPRAVVG